VVVVEIDGPTVASLYKLIRPHFDRRITSWTRSRLRAGMVVTALVATLDLVVVGLSAVVLDPAGIERGVTVVLSDYRNRGVGSALLKRRTELRAGVISRVAGSNAASLRMCAKAGLSVSGEEELEKGRKVLLVAS
jgi:GNAT superfamily N-acetyltransferase